MFHILCLISAATSGFVFSSLVKILFTWFLVTCRRLSTVVQSSLGLERSKTRTTAKDLLNRHYLVTYLVHEAVSIFIQNHTCTPNVNIYLLRQNSMWQHSKMALRNILHSEETFLLSLVQSYYFGNFQSSIVFGDCLQTVKYANILSPVVPSCTTEDFLLLCIPAIP